MGGIESWTIKHRILMYVWILKGRHDEMYRGMWPWDDMLAALLGFAENDQLQHVGGIRWMSGGTSAVRDAGLDSEGQE